MAEQFKPDKIPYRFYVLFSKKVFSEWSWTWNLKLNGIRFQRIKSCSRIILCSLMIGSIVAWGVSFFVSSATKGILFFLFEKYWWLLFLIAVLLWLAAFFVGSWTRFDYYLKAGLALYDPPEPNTDYKPKGVPESLSIVINRESDPMCWGYAMRLYCEKILYDAITNKEIEIGNADIDAYTAKKRPWRWKPLSPEKFISYIPNKPFWNYNKLYDLAKADVSGGNSCDKQQVIERFLEQAAHDFCQKYIRHADSILAGKQVWIADKKKKQYYCDIWAERVKQLQPPSQGSQPTSSQGSQPDSRLGNTDFKPNPEFMDIVIAEMEDAERNANRHLKKRTQQKKLAFALPIINAGLTAVVTTMNTMYEDMLDSEHAWMTVLVSALRIIFIVLTFLTAALSAWIISISESGKESEETWLRQKVCLAKLQSETQKFCDGTGNYNNSDLKENIRTYMAKIEEVRHSDWKQFFDNMDYDGYDK